MEKQLDKYKTVLAVLSDTKVKAKSKRTLLKSFKGRQFLQDLFPRILLELKQTEFEQHGS